MNTRKILYYRYSERNSEFNTWNFLIVNTQDEIGKIKQKIYAQLNPMLEEKRIDSGKTLDASLFYDLFCIQIQSSSIYIPRIYQGEFKWDRKLAPRQTGNGWNEFINQVYTGKI